MVGGGLCQQCRHGALPHGAHPVRHSLAAFLPACIFHINRVITVIMWDGTSRAATHTNNTHSPVLPCRKDKWEAERGAREQAEAAAQQAAQQQSDAGREAQALSSQLEQSRAECEALRGELEGERAAGRKALEELAAQLRAQAEDEVRRGWRGGGRGTQLHPSGGEEGDGWGPWSLNASPFLVGPGSSLVIFNLQPVPNVLLAPPAYTQVTNLKAKHSQQLDLVAARLQVGLSWQFLPSPVDALNNKISLNNCWHSL